MKRLLLTAGLLSFFFVAVSQPRILTRHEITVGGGLSYRHGIVEEFMAPGINVEGYYHFVDEFRAGLDITYYLVDFGFSSPAFEINVNTGTLLFEEDLWLIYGLAGFQFIWIDYDWGEPFGNEKHYGVGFSLGGSVEYDLNYIRIFAEPKMTLYNLDSFRSTPSISIGVRYTL